MGVIDGPRLPSGRPERAEKRQVLRRPALKFDIPQHVLALVDHALAAPGRPPTAATFLDAAHRIGRRIAADARWADGACTWRVMSPDRATPGARRVVPSDAGGTLYDGTAGIALFLAELAAVTADGDVARAAVGGVRHALRAGAGLPESAFGFHAGRVGIAYAAVRVAQVLDHPEFVPESGALLRPLAGNESRDAGLDVIAGGGGAIPALLRLARHVAPELAAGIARRLGDHLVAAATRDGDGFSWPTMHGTAIRNLCGYAHGAAGIGHGLLELYAATGDGGYRYAAEQAFLYERRFLDPSRSNWPDLRHAELGEYLFDGRVEELRARLRAGDPLAPPPPRYMNAWCHGAPGIGLSRLRAYELLGDPAYLHQARAAFTSVQASLVAEAGMNFSLCHGRFGNAETLLEGARRLGEDGLLDPVREIALGGIRRHEDAGEPWPCGTLGGVQDPGLMLGEAGIGLFLLRLARPDVPSSLFLTAPAAAPARGGLAGAEGYAALRERTVDEHFGRTLRIFRALGEEAHALVPRRAMGAAPRASDVEAAHAAIAAHVAGVEDGDRRALLEDAFLPDRAPYELARSVTDYTREYADALARLPAEEVDWRAGRIALSPRARVAATRWDWDAWLERGGAAAAPPEADQWFLAHFAGTRATLRRLSPLAALVLQAVRQPASLQQVIASVGDAVGGDPAPSRRWLEERVVAQLTEAYRAGFVTHPMEHRAG